MSTCKIRNYLYIPFLVINFVSEVLCIDMQQLVLIVLKF